MTNRQRFHETLSFGKPDRVPFFKEGIRRDVIKFWQKQGLCSKTNIFDLIKMDNSHEIDLDYDPVSTLSKPPNSIKDLSSIKNDFKKQKDSSFRRRLKLMLPVWEKQDTVLLLKVHPGFFLTMGANSWKRFSEVVLLLIDNPEFVRQTMCIQSRLIAQYLDEILPDLDIDAVVFSEPIAGNAGPLISPEMYAEFALKSYKQILDVVYKHGISTVIMRSYANIRLLIPSIIETGFNCLWACETNSVEMDYRLLRKEFGRDLSLIGGIDADVLRKGKDAILKEIEEKIPPLITSGGFIPLADGRIRKDISFENYIYYRHLLETIILK